MFQAHATDHQPDTVADDGQSLEASDEFEDPGCYCPNELLGTFALLMAGLGRSVSASMMLGDPEYAMWQLGRARATGDEQLRVVAARLFAYFDDPRGWAAGMKVEE